MAPDCQLFPIWKSFPTPSRPKLVHLHALQCIYPYQLKGPELTQHFLFSLATTKQSFFLQSSQEYRTHRGKKFLGKHCKVIFNQMPICRQNLRILCESGSQRSQTREVFLERFWPNIPSDSHREEGESIFWREVCIICSTQRSQNRIVNQNTVSPLKVDEN